ncbi:MAG: sulfotransferase [Acetobacteraceae bacterium]
MNAPVSALCDCGSGLRAVRCCAAQFQSLPPPEATRHLVPLVERAIQAHRQGAIETAERLCLDVLELAPDRPGALSVLYEIRKAQGSARAAEALIRRIVALDPNNLAATNELALILLGKGSLAEAEHHARNAVRIAPENAQAHNLMGMILTEANRPQTGEYHYRRVLELSAQRDPILLANLAWNLKNQGRMKEARTLYEESAAAAPQIRQTLLGFARLEEADRNFDAAAAILDAMEAQFPGDQGVRLTRAVLLGRMRRYDDALAIIDASAGDKGQLGPTELLEKGRLLDQLGRYDDAWAAFAEGKRLGRELSGQAYLDDEARQQLDRLRGFFTAGRLRLVPRAGVRGDVPQPIFILGFPRSGTTLVEQTLSAHPAIAAGDELPLINEITAIMPRMLASPLGYPEALAELWMGDQREGLDNLRDYYLQKVRQMGVLRAGAKRFTDKMPLNETHLGLIALLFPEAPLIHVLRHPLDVMVSAFSNQFTHGFFCAYDLETAARHYVRVMDLVQHYRAEMTLRYLPIRYEDIVAEQEASVRAMLAFVGEDFNKACLTFHKNRRYARTASYAQVAEPLYARSMYRYRHYRAHLEPVVPILQPVIERLGYTVD